jgi:hypothetical protein
VTQLALDFERLAGQGPNVSRFHISAMIESLRGRGWQTAKQLGATSESSKRVLRAIAEESAGEIVSGQKGYKLTRECTLEEVGQAGWLKSQGQKMLDRWLAIQRVYHRALHP